MREPNPRLARARQRKAELLPQITRLAAEGRNSREIAAATGVPKSPEPIRHQSRDAVQADSPGCRLLVDQLMDFPLGEHDDGLDALEMCTRLPLEVMR